MANKNIRTLSSRKELNDNLFENIADLSQKNASKMHYYCYSYALLQYTLFII